MECPDRLVLSGALFIIITLLLIIFNPFCNVIKMGVSACAIITGVISTILMVISWFLPPWISLSRGESLADCDLIQWVIGGMIGLMIMMPILFYVGGG